jgi:pimeloyl-ACP methyl ester carboxylesterase
MARTSTRANPDSDLVGKHVRTLPRRFRQDAANGLSAEWELRVGQEVFAISIADHACFVREGPCVAPSTVIVTDPDTWLDIDEGRTTGGEAFLSRRLSMSGNVDLAVRLQTLFRPYRRARRASDMDQIEVDAWGLRLSSYMVGSGPPVVLIHGLGATKITWLPLIPSLAERYRVIVPDLPGHGESEKPKTDYTPRFFARTLRHLMDALDVDTAPILGNSLGGRIALELALRSPNRVDSLTLLDPSVPGMRWRYILGFTRVIPTELGAIPFPMRERMTRVILRRLFGDPGRLTDDAYSVAAKEFMRIYADPRARVAFFSALRHIITERPEAFYGSLRRIKQPTLVIFGDSDRLVPLRLGVRLSEHLPNCELVVLPGVGHVPQFEATDETIAAVGTFLASL